jgi:hypothetical protein
MARKREAPYGFKYVLPTLAEQQERYEKGRKGYRIECLGCAKRIWGVGLAIGSHRGACKGRPE